MSDHAPKPPASIAKVLAYRVDMRTKGQFEHWIGTDVADYDAARRLIDAQPNHGYRFRIVAVTETVLWES